MYNNSLGFAAPATGGAGALAVTGASSTGWLIVGVFALMTLGGVLMRLTHRPAKD
ncbi:MAG: hypothetical protein L0H96_11585 [Humibacillus sp.]|nr:hypothetical protein [Humibacillus sp.]MDN5777545.1 hypothetical protein [Humibacillus sp.]